MLHQDGLEVYLKPRTANFTSLKFREVPMPQDSHEPQLCESVVHSSPDELVIVVKISENFDMANIPALSITVTVHGDADQSQKWTATREELQGAGHYVIHSWSNVIMFRGYRILPGQGPRRVVINPPGDLSVTLSASADADQNPEQEDLVYSFKFHTLPRGAYKQRVKKYRGTMPPPAERTVEFYTADEDWEADCRRNDMRRVHIASHKERPERPRARLTGPVLRPQPEVCYCGLDKTSRRRKRATGATDVPTKAGSKKRTPEKPDAETMVSSCGKCQKIKPAPKGRKIIWRIEKGWMYASMAAQEEDIPDQAASSLAPPPASPRRADSGLAPNSGSNEENIDQSNRDESITRPDVISEPRVDKANEHNQVHGPESRASENDSRNPEQSILPPEDPRTAVTHGREQAARNHSTDEVADARSGERIEDSTVLIVAPASPKAPPYSAVIPPQSRTPQPSPAADVDVAVVEDTVAVQLEDTETADDSEAVLFRELFGGPLIEGRPSKKQRIEIDLTLDESDVEDLQVASIKEEAPRDVKPCIHIDLDDDDADELQDMDLQIQKNQLEQLRIKAQLEAVELQQRRNKLVSQSKRKFEHIPTLVKVEPQGAESFRSENDLLSVVKAEGAITEFLSDEMGRIHRTTWRQCNQGA